MPLVDGRLVKYSTQMLSQKSPWLFNEGNNQAFVIFRKSFNTFMWDFVQMI